MIFSTHFKPGLIISLLAFLTIGTNAQNRGRISGTVVDKFTQKPIFNVNVVLDGIAIGAVSDSNGVFRITSIETRSYNNVDMAVDLLVCWFTSW